MSAQARATKVVASTFERRAARFLLTAHDADARRGVHDDFLAPATADSATPGSARSP